MSQRILFTITAVFISTGVWLLMQKPAFLKAQTEQTGANPFVEAEDQTAPGGEQKHPSGILSDAVARELDRELGTDRAKLPQIVPGTTRPRIKPAPAPQSAKSTNDAPASRANPLAAPNRQSTENGSDALRFTAGFGNRNRTAAESAVAPAILQSERQEPEETESRSPLSILKRALPGLNRRSETPPEPRRFVPSNPQPVSEDVRPLTEAAQGDSAGEIVQVQQNSSIMNELEKLYQKDGRQMPSFQTPNTPVQAPQHAAPGPAHAPQQHVPQQHAPHNPPRRPFWKRLLGVGEPRRPQPRTTAGHQHAPGPRIGRSSVRPHSDPRPRYPQSRPQSRRVPPASQDYRSRNHPGLPRQGAMRTVPYGRQGAPSGGINRQPSGVAMPGDPRSLELNRRQQAAPINGDAPRFDPFSQEFDPFAEPKPAGAQNAGGVARGTSTPQQDDPFSEDFNPFDAPEEVAEQPDSQPQSVPDSRSDPNSEEFDPFYVPRAAGGPAFAKQADDSGVSGAEQESARTPKTATQVRQPAASPPSRELNPFQAFDDIVDAETAASPERQPAAETAETETAEDDFQPFEEPETAVSDEEPPAGSMPDDPFAGADPFDDSGSIDVEESEPATEMPKVVPNRTQSAETAPRLPVIQGNQNAVRNGTAPTTEETGPPPGADDFNPFPEVSEKEADAENPSSDDPFTGITLGDDTTEPGRIPVTSQPEQLEVPKTQAETDAGGPELETNPAREHPLADQAGANDATTGEQSRKDETGIAADSGSKAKTGPKIARQEDQRSKWQKISERLGLKGFKGFCPVELRDNRNLVDIQPRHRARYESRTYFFSSEEAKKKFEASPEEYAPVQGGTDIVALIDHEKHAQGSLDHAVWYKNRLYFFHSAENLKTFVKQPGNYLEKLAERTSEALPVGMGEESETQ